ncbi:MAG: glycosyltransferase [Novosphingobium sp.]
MAKDRPVRIALVWAQFAAYHIDRSEAVAHRLAGRAEVLAVEVATTSTDYAWGPSGAINGARKLTLFPGHSYEALSGFQRFFALFRALRHSDWVMIGLSYAAPDVIALTWLLRLFGAKIVVFSESKADDRPRKALIEWGKRVVMTCYHGAIVGAARHVAYMRSLGLQRRPILPGYDGVGIARIRAQARQVLAPDGAAFAERPFVFVGRFVDKKNLPNLIDGYAAYVAAAGTAPRRLVLAGSGAEEAEIRRRMDLGGVSHLVDFPGFLSAEQVSQLLSRALALMLVSREEQWGLVVNEALALGIPVIVSRQVGSRDALVRDGVNGWVVDSESTATIASAMASMASDEGQWRRQVSACHARAWLGDTERLADAVESILNWSGPESSARITKFAEEVA